MCPVRVHWHVKQSYTQYWRVKITITNLNLVQNYSQWNLVALHPNLQSVTQVFSFNYKPLNQYGYISKFKSICLLPVMQLISCIPGGFSFIGLAIITKVCYDNSSLLIIQEGVEDFTSEPFEF